MEIEVFSKDQLKVGKQVWLLACCTGLEIRHNISTPGGFREIYSIAGKNGVSLDCVLFKSNVAEAELPANWEGCAVEVKGTIGLYKEEFQLVIENIRNVSSVIDAASLASSLEADSYLSELKDIIYNLTNRYVTITSNHSGVSLGLEKGGYNEALRRMCDLLLTAAKLYPDIVDTYIELIPLELRIYKETHNKLSEKLPVITAARFTEKERVLFAALHFYEDTDPELRDFVLLHHLIMKPRGVQIEIHNTYTNNNSGALRL